MVPGSSAGRADCGALAGSSPNHDNEGESWMFNMCNNRSDISCNRVPCKTPFLCPLIPLCSPLGVSFLSAAKNDALNRPSWIMSNEFPPEQRISLRQRETLKESIICNAFQIPLSDPPLIPLLPPLSRRLLLENTIHPWPRLLPFTHNQYLLFHEYSNCFSYCYRNGYDYYIEWNDLVEFWWWTIIIYIFIR